ncbi:hypothetical protein KIPB_016043, partial [Kipferlia bialata]
HPQDSVADDEDAARSLYTHLADTVQTHYMEKQAPETQQEMRAKGKCMMYSDTLQCLPADRYFEEVWAERCLQKVE